ncbi:MAG: sarcosine oxidase subunit delta [Halieaceae bacterium]|jgi:sarcosine oxidase subunit delta
MKIMHCPLNGPRNITEFSYGGELHSMPDHQTTNSRDWAEYIFFNDNAAAVVTEWWCHSATSYWFLAERDTTTDEILRTYPAGEKFRQRVEFSITPESEKPR